MDCRSLKSLAGGRGRGSGSRMRAGERRSVVGDVVHVAFAFVDSVSARAVNSVSAKVKDSVAVNVLNFSFMFMGSVSARDVSANPVVANVGDVVNLDLAVTFVNSVSARVENSVVLEILFVA